MIPFDNRRRPSIIIVGMEWNHGNCGWVTDLYAYQQVNSRLSSDDSFSTFRSRNIRLITCTLIRSIYSSIPSRSLTPSSSHCLFPVFSQNRSRITFTPTHEPLRTHQTLFLLLLFHSRESFSSYSSALLTSLCGIVWGHQTRREAWEWDGAPSF